MPGVKVLSGNGPRAAVRAVCLQFAQTNGVAVVPQFDVNPEVIARAQGGEDFDVAIGNPATIDALVASKHVTGGRVDFGRAGLGVAVKSGARKPDISSVDAFKKTLLAAKAVAFPGKGASGIYFVGLVERLGLKDAMRGTLKPIQAEDVVEMVARGEADMVVVVATRIVDVPGVDYVGGIPAELQTHIGFSAGLSAAARQPKAGQALIEFFKTPAAAETLKAKGVEPV
jgi:molybdate transport system substrate-binding protein